MKKGVFSIFSYLLVISISIIVSSSGEIIIGIFFVLVAGIMISIGFFGIRSTLKDKSDVLDILSNPNNTIHLIIPIVFLILVFLPRIIWFIWPTIGLFLIESSEPSIATVVVPLLSIELGGIFYYYRLQQSAHQISPQE